MYHLFLLFCLVIYHSKVDTAPLLWISLDAFGNSTLNQKNTPFLYNLAMKSVLSIKHHPNYITKTFPNHFSAVTGLNEEDHEIVGNVMKDPILGWFNQSNLNPKWWNPNGTTLPIWTINEIYGKKSSAVIFWPGGSVEFGIGKKVLPKYHTKKYDFHCECKCRLKKAYKLMLNNNFDLIMVYIDDIDKIGHISGPDSPEFLRTVKNVDRLLEILYKKINFNKKLKKWNLMISSDHGMKQMTKSKVLLLDDFIPSSLKYELIITGSQGQLNLLRKTDFFKIYKVLSKHVGVYMVAKPETMPSRYKYTHCKKIPDVTIIMKEGWYVARNKAELELSWINGDHGYPVDIAPSMYAFFLANGPNFKTPFIIPKTYMTDLFGVACFILQLNNHCQLNLHSQNLAQSIVTMNTTQINSKNNIFYVNNLNVVDI